MSHLDYVVHLQSDFHWKRWGNSLHENTERNW